MSTKAGKAYRTICCSFFNRTCISFSSVVWRLNETFNLLCNNLPGDIDDVNQGRGKNTELNDIQVLLKKEQQMVL